MKEKNNDNVVLIHDNKTKNNKEEHVNVGLNVKIEEENDIDEGVCIKMEALDVEFDIEKEAHTYFTSDDNESVIKTINNDKLSSDISNDLVASKEENVDVGVLKYACWCEYRGGHALV